MAKVRSWAGLDVHARSVLVTMDAAAGPTTSERPDKGRDRQRDAERVLRLLMIDSLPLGTPVTVVR